MTCFSPSTLPVIAAYDPSKHVNYTIGMVLGVDDFNQDFTFLSAQDRRIVRDVAGYGVVWGLGVSVDVGTSGPRVQVQPGEAILPSGQLVGVSPTQCANLGDWLTANVADLGSPPGTEVTLHVVLRYHECPTDDVPIPGEPCRTDEELMAPSRLKQCFDLDLQLEAPAQIEEDAVRAFAAWLAQVPREAGAGPGVDALRATLVAAAGLDASPPPEPGDLLTFLAAPPPAGVAIWLDDAASYKAALLRFWIEELRPRLRTPIPGAEADPDDAGPDLDCLLLATLAVPITVDAVTGALVVADTPDVGVDESARPELLHLRMLQELLLGGSTPLTISGTVVPPSPAAAGPATATGGITATALDSDATVFALDYPGFDADAEHIVAGQPFTFLADKPATFEVIPPADPDLPALLGSPPTPGVVVRVRDSSDKAVRGFTVRIDQREATP